MTIEPFAFTPTDGLCDKEVFPAVPESEDAAREQFMVLFNQLKDKINEIIENM